MTRLPPLALDFAATRPPPPRWGLALLAVGLAACGAVALDYLAAASDLAALNERLLSLERRSARQGTAPTQAAAGEAAARQAGEAARQLRRPWDSLLRDLEGAVTPEVALLAVEPDATRQQLRISGEARKLGDALDFIRRLEKAPRLQRPTLSGHQTRQGEGGPVVAFTILAGWKED